MGARDSRLLGWPSTRYSIPVYRVSEEKLNRVLDAPPVELGRDILAELYSHRR